MIRIHQIILLFITTIMLSACATTTKQLNLSADDIKTLKLAFVQVNFPSDEKIGWGRYKRERARILKGTSVTEKSGIEITTIEQLREQRLVQPFKDIFPKSLEDTFVGTRPVRAEVDVADIHIVSAGQSLLLGGSSAVVAKTTFIDMETGEVLAVYDSRLAGQSGYLAGGVLGVIVGEAGERNKYEKSVFNYARAVNFWLENQ